MFGSSRSASKPSGFGQALPTLQAMFDGKTEEARRAMGASLCPWMPFLHAFSFDDRGERYALASSLPMAAAIARFGDLAALEGLASREDFFLPAARIEDRLPRDEHTETSIPMACAIEAIKLGRVDMLDALAQAGIAREEAWKKQYEGQRRPWHLGEDRALEIARLDSRDAERLMSRLAFAPCLDAKTRLAALDWIKKHAPDPQGLPRKHGFQARIASLWTSLAAQSGQASSVEAAIALKAKFDCGHLLQIARHGLFDLAQSIAPHALEGGSDPDDFFGRSRQKEDPKGVCASMASSFLSSLDRIAQAFFENASTTGSREVTWADFCDDRELHHRGAIMALEGAFDTAQDQADFAKLEAARDRLASAARALASACPEGSAPLDPADIEKIRPHAPATREELIFLARIGSPRLPQALALAAPPEADPFAGDLFSLYRDVAKAAEPRGEPGSRASERSALMATKLEALEESIYRLNEAAPLALSDSARDNFHEQIASVDGLLQRLEKRSLHAAAHPASRSGRVLKV